MAGCSCIRGNFDFDIRAISLDTIIYTDLSDWMTDPPYVVPSTYFIEITPPNGLPPRRVEVNALNSTKLSLEDLNLPSSCCLPDGIYCIKAWGCYDANNETEGEKKYTRHVAITPQAQCQIDNIISTNEDFKIGMKLQSQMIQLQAASSLEQTKEATMLYKYLKQDLEKYNCNFCKC